MSALLNRFERARQNLISVLGAENEFNFVRDIDSAILLDILNEIEAYKNLPVLEKLHLWEYVLSLQKYGYKCVNNVINAPR